MRSPHIRILVLGPPVGYPRCFDDYYYYNIEVMLSGPEVARAMMEWVANPLERKRLLVERAANDAKQRALLSHPRSSSIHEGGETEHSRHGVEMETTAVTLSNVSGQDLAKEVRAILINQHVAKAASSSPKPKPKTSSTSSVTTPSTVPSTAPSSQNTFRPVWATATKPPSPLVSNHKKGEIFGGIEAAAKTSRMRHIAAAKASEVFVEDEDNICNTPSKSAVATAASRVKRRLRWHASVDSGMGRLGFRTEPVPKGDTSGKLDTVDIIKEMVNAEVHTDAPLGAYERCFA